MSAQRWASAIHINAGTRVESRICVIVANRVIVASRVIVAKRARRSSPQRVIGVAKELAHGDIAVGLCAAEAACAQRVGEGAGAEARGRRGNAEAGHFQCPALAFEQVARRREGRMLIPRRTRIILIGLAINSCRPANQMRRRRTLPHATDRARFSRLCVGLDIGRSTYQRHQILGIFATRTKTDHRAHSIRHRAQPQHRADCLPHAPKERKEGNARHAAIYAAVPARGVRRNPRSAPERARLNSKIGACQ